MGRKISISQEEVTQHCYLVYNVYVGAEMVAGGFSDLEDAEDWIARHADLFD